MLAENPWSGYYHVGKSIWVHAHTTQFTKIGWRYLDDASGYLTGGGSYVTLRSPDTGDWTTVVETMDATAPQTLDLDVTGGLSTGTVHEWSSDLESSDPKDMFVHAGDLAGSGGRYSVTLQPGHVYTLSTTTGQHKGDAAPVAGPAEQMRLPYREDFDGYGSGRLARYFSDINGGFETAPCGGGRDGTCYRQQVTQKPIAWNGTGDMDPTTVMGDPRWWGDYRVSTQALLEDAGAVELLGRVDAQKGTRVSGYHLRVGSDGAWRLYSEDLFGADVTLASGTVPLDAARWHRLALRFQGEDVSAWIDDAKVADVSDASHRTGQVGLRVAGFAHAQFDDVAVEPSAAAPAFVPHADMTATATSQHSANYSGYEYSVPNAIDDRPETMWSAEFDPSQPLPQAVTLDLGSVRPTQALTYQPRLDANSNGMITAWHVDVSTDGSSYATVARGTWPVGTGTKVISWSERSARYVRLVADETPGCPGKAPTAAELNVVSGGRALAPTTAVGDGGGAAFDHTVPQSEMTATASSQYSSAYLPEYAIDGDCTTFWHSAPAATGPLPATLTLDLGGEHAVDGITYLPRQDGNPNGQITRWEVATSEDGSSWTTAASGTWSEDSTRKAATWPAVPARYLRLTALAGHAGVASAAEIQVGEAASP